MSLTDLTAEEINHSGRLAGVIGLRMLGLFLVLPVLVLMAESMPGYTPALAGLAVGIYGLSQAVLQQPFGHLSDRLGRRKVMIMGLLLFIAGSVVAALANHMLVLVAGRMLQGCGAIAGVALAFAADRVHADRRASAMAIIGMSIGASFLVSIMLSVPLANLFGLSGLFWLTAILGALGLAVVAGMSEPTHRPEVVSQDRRPIAGIGLLSASVFLLHALLTAVFVVLPGEMHRSFGVALADHWKIYVPAMLVSALLVFPVLRKIAAMRLQHAVLPWGFVGLSIALVLFATAKSSSWLLPGYLVFFLAFNLLEAAMPSMVAGLAGAAGRGGRMGIYTTWQFLGAFVGGSMAGLMLGQAGASRSLMILGLVSIAWAWVFRLRAKTLAAAI
ncbi:MAG: MFS transporter [Xanthomonadales bacterium]|nr:MFS transporter [Xanthomonadales bacterium]